MDNSQIKERILQFIKVMGLSVAQFERRSGLSNGYIRNFKGSFGGNKFDSILQAFPELNRTWVTTGKGEMMLPKPQETITITESTVDESVVANHSKVEQHIEQPAPTPLTDDLEEMPTEAKDVLLKQAQSEITYLREQLAKANEQIATLTQAIVTLSKK